MTAAWFRTPRRTRPGLFLQFPNSGLEGSGVTFSSANLHLFDTWASTCTAQKVEVAAVYQPFDVRGLRTFPGPTMGGSIGGGTPNVPNACKNTAADRAVGDWVSLPVSVSVLGPYPGRVRRRRATSRRRPPATTRWPHRLSWPYAFTTERRPRTTSPSQTSTPTTCRLGPPQYSYTTPMLACAQSAAPINKVN